MTNFNYFTGIPATNNTPATDQPNMQINTDENAGIWNVDHVGFNSANGGTHLQTTFSSKNTPSSLPTDPASIVYTANGTASTNAQLFFSNASIVTLLSGIKAFATIDGAASLIQSLNIATTLLSIGPGEYIYTITLANNAVAGTNYAVIFSNSSSTGTINPYYTIISSTQFSMTFPSPPTQISFVVIQI